jgi:ribosomal protein S18 acetylase RimI-like enzyme
MSVDDRPAVEIRIAEPADGVALVGAIEQIDRETEYLGVAGERLAWADRPAAMLDDFRRTGDGVYLIAADGDAIVGYLGALAGHYRSTRGVLSIPHIGVRQAHRRHGIARRLLSALEASARERGAHRIDLSVDDDNAPARALYRACGFVEEGHVREAVLERDGWRSYIALAKLLDGGSRALAPVTSERRSRPDSIAVRFRPAVETDAAALRDWELALLAAPPSLLKSPEEVAPLERFQDDLGRVCASAQHFLVVALTDVGGAERVVGLLAVSAKPGARLQYDLAIVVNVLTDYRALGIGRRLFAIGEDWARARQAHRLSTTVHAANDCGLRFAAAMGFVQEAVMRRYARFGEVHVDLLGLAKFLPAA